MNIGKHVTITKAKNKTIEGTTGEIINETKNTITIRTTTKDKKIIKNTIIEETQ